MTSKYKGAGKTFYDITGYGKEGKIEGMTRAELVELNEELTDYLLNNVDVSEMMEKFDELLRSFMCPSGLLHNVNCDCGGRKKK